MTRIDNFLLNDWPAVTEDPNGVFYGYAVADVTFPRSYVPPSSSNSGGGPAISVITFPTNGANTNPIRGGVSGLAAAPQNYAVAMYLQGNDDTWW
jgi:hypothetical protein